CYGDTDDGVVGDSDEVEVVYGGGGVMVIPMMVLLVIVMKWRWCMAEVVLNGEAATVGAGGIEAREGE
ncbi:hypothetical protein Tco_0651409, partial [Tanacetum coccineum]